MKNKIVAILIIVTTISACQNTSKKGADISLQGDITRERIQNNEVYGAMNIYDNKWPVQFMIETEDFGHTVKTLNSVSNCVLITEFENHEISPADVHCWEAKMILFNDTVKVSKMTHTDWELPIYSFNWKESFEQVKSDSKIEDIERTLNQNQIKYTLVDYLKN